MSLLPSFATQEPEMNPFYLLAIISLMLVSSATTFAEPYSASCGMALEKLYKAQKVLIPFQRSMELAQIHERVALSETLLTCMPGGIYSVQRAQRCSQATWEAPQRIKETLEAEDVYLQGRRVFEEQLAWVRQVCLLEP
jgi:hypothetical protein